MSNKKGNKSKNTSNTRTCPPKKKKKHPFVKWCKRNAPVIQIIMMLIGIFTLAAYIRVSIDQGIKTRKAIEIADSSMKTSERIADIQEKYSKAELIPYIAILEVEPRVNIGKNIGIKIQYENFGKTPAFIVRCFANYRLGNSKIIKIDKEHLIEFKSKSTNTRPSDISSSFDCNFNRIISRETHDSIINHKVEYYVFGLLTYNDAFGESHKIDFCKIFTSIDEDMDDYNCNYCKE